MAHNPNNPNENNPNPGDSRDPLDVPQSGTDDAADVRFEDLPDFGPVDGPIDLSEIADDTATPEPPASESDVWTTPASPLPPADSPLPDVGTISLGTPSVPDDSADMNAHEALEELMELPEMPVDESSSLFPRPDPIPPLRSEIDEPDASIHEGVVDVGTQDSPIAIDPASGWLAGGERHPATKEELLAKLAGSDSDLFGGRTGRPLNDVESSDIFKGSPPIPGDRSETSDVLVGAIYGEPEEPSAHGPPPSARVEPELEMVSGTENDGDHMLPEAQELPDDLPTTFDASDEDDAPVFEGTDSLFDMAGEGQLFEEDLPTQLASSDSDDEDEHVTNDGDSLFESPEDGSIFDEMPASDSTTHLAEALDAPPEPTQPRGHVDADLKELGIVPDFGATPDLTPDASSILADLTELKPRHHGDSSDVQFGAPGIGRTVGGDDDDGTEFDLTIGEQMPPELADAEAEADPDWKSSLPADMFGTMPEMDLPEPAQAPVAKAKPPKLEPTEPVPSLAGSEDDDGASVEFSDFPEAEDEASISRIFNPGSEVKPVASAPVEPPSATRRPTPIPSESELELPDLEGTTDLPEVDPNTLDWNLAEEESSKKPSLPVAPIGKGSRPAVDLTKLTGTDPGTPKTPSNAGKGRGTTLPAPEGEKKSSSPSVEIDWMSGSMPEKPVQLDAPVEVADWSASAIHSRAEKAPPVTPPEYAPTRPEPVPEPVWVKPGSEEHEDHEPDLEPRREPASSRAGRGGKGGWVGGTLVGMVLAGGAFAGAYFGGLIPGSGKTAGVQPNLQDGKLISPTDPSTPGSRPDNSTASRVVEPTAADVAAAVRAGDAARAKALAAGLRDASPFVQAARGEAELFAIVQDPKLSGSVPADHPELKSIRERLQSLVNDAETAKTPAGEKAAVKAAIQLGVSHQIAGDRESAKRVYMNARERFPNHSATFDAALDRLEVTAPEPAPPPMPDGNSRRDNDPIDARVLLFTILLLQPEPAAEPTLEAGDYFWTAVKKARAEEFTEAIELIKKARAAHIKQAKAAAGRGLNPLSDPLEEIFPRCCDDLKTYWELRAAIYDNKSIADLIKKVGTSKALAELEAAQKLAADAVKLATDLKDANDKLKEAADKLKDATDKLKDTGDKLTVATKDVKDAKDLVAKLEKDVKEASDAKADVEKKLQAEEKARKGADEVVSAVISELQAAKLLPEKFDSADVLAAQKKAMDRATGPTLSSLVNPGMIAVGGAGLTSAQLIDIAERLAKSEAAAKSAAEKLASELKRITTEHAEATKKITTEHAEAMKKLSDNHALTVTKLKDDQTAELKKAAEKFTSDMKKLTEDYEGKIKTLDAAVLKEKKVAEEIAAKCKIELANSVSPSQAIDLWLPLLSELRRPSDSEPALVAAEKALASTTPDSEEAAKARTVAGLAYLFANKYPEAKTQFQAARSNPNYEAALQAKKLWATAADLGLTSISDPLAAYRRLPELPPRDRAVAVRHLDAGVKAYKENRFEDAVKALTDATKADAGDPVAWYFLGAAKWALGEKDQAKDDILQGSVRESASNVPTRTVNAALAPIQGAVRDAITAARP